MEEALRNILYHTYNPDTTLRLQAEKSLDEFLQHPGAYVSILR